ncbi:MAG TPA: glycoside hydrolase family 3 C-terminal domain-containing protein [Oscillospiraceae bacterium]|nr:glycoside hydrolase family 3 C-terminal domain-containing protein [Oscillospiraceae bacterium]HXK77819.1 glycoside hydrolase family 3 C-terminal domain-containing protein [Oscillospiraceae bacterium]
MRNRREAEEQAKALVARMTLDEAASMLHHSPPAVDRLGIPPYSFWNEALHGVARAGIATVFPQAIAMAAMFDTETMRKIGEAVSTEARAKFNENRRHGDFDLFKGLTFWSPNVNIFRDPRWGRGQETYGEDPYLTACTACAYIEGIQGSGPYLRAAATAKHFAVHSGPEALRHRMDVEPSMKDFRETYLPAFEACIREAEVEIIMGAYQRLFHEPCCGSGLLLKKILRGEWGFRGHVVSDFEAIEDFYTGHKVVNTREEACALALNSGCDGNSGYSYITSAADACRHGLVSEETIRAAAVHMLTTRYMLGIMPGQETEYDRIPYEKVECPEHIALALEACKKSCVLLKKGTCLPLNLSKIGTLGVIGPNANSRRALMGNYYGSSSRYITVLEGIQDAAGEQTRVLTSNGSGLFEDHTEFNTERNNLVGEALTVAERSDVVLLVLGLDERLEAEEPDASNPDALGDRKGLYLPAVQREMADAVLKIGKPTVLVLMAGSCLDIEEIAGRCDSVLLCWYPGARGGKAVADLLFGRASPSGKLPVTFYRNSWLAGHDFCDYGMAGRTCRYLDEEPLYPFGYGLTYGDVSVTGAEPVSPSEGGVTFRVGAKNEGVIDTEDVIEVYVKDASPFAPKNPRLCAYKKIFLAAGEERAFEIALSPETFLVYDDAGEHIPGAGTCTLWFGTGQPDARSAKLTGKRPVRLEWNY